MPFRFRTTEEIRKLLSPKSPMKPEAKKKLRDGILRGTVRVKRTETWEKPSTKSQS